MKKETIIYLIINFGILILSWLSFIYFESTASYCCTHVCGITNNPIECLPYYFSSMLFFIVIVFTGINIFTIVSGKL